MLIHLPFVRIIALTAAGLLLPSAGFAQNAAGAASKTEAMQIGEPEDAPDRADPAGKAFLDERTPSRSRSSLMQGDGDQIGTKSGNGTPQTQITALGESGSRMAQLSKADLDATLAQLTPAERRVLLQTIEGTDICDNPPAVAAVIALCRTRIETRSGEFTAPPEQPLSAEERLLRGGIDETGTPSIQRVIDRLSRVTIASSNDFSNQAIASIALAPPPEPPTGEEDQNGLGTGLGNETEALINAIVQQLGGAGVGP
ncbi:hypothetical protein J3454_10830 [Erythrobacter sp. NFXS35]|uniref:hypothetical protein n=1 Tax=Erythrobacter sp. NFXS35 TaxID=2818436 RepID=UPI0032DED466